MKKTNNGKISEPQITPSISLIQKMNFRNLEGRKVSTIYFAGSMH